MTRKSYEPKRVFVSASVQSHSACDPIISRIKDLIPKVQIINLQTSIPLTPNLKDKALYDYPKLKNYIEKAHSNSGLFSNNQKLQEPQKGDKRWRYSDTERIKIYSAIKKKLDETGPILQLSAENPDMRDKIGLDKNIIHSGLVYQYSERMMQIDKYHFISNSDTLIECWVLIFKFIQVNVLLGYLIIQNIVAKLRLYFFNCTKIKSLFCAVNINLNNRRKMKIKLKEIYLEMDYIYSKIDENYIGNTKVIADIKAGKKVILPPTSLLKMPSNTGLVVILGKNSEEAYYGAYEVIKKFKGQTQLRFKVLFRAYFEVIPLNCFADPNDPGSFVLQFMQAVPKKIC